MNNKGSSPFMRGTPSETDISMGKDRIIQKPGITVTRKNNKAN